MFAYRIIYGVVCTYPYCVQNSNLHSRNLHFSSTFAHNITKKQSGPRDRTCHQPGAIVTNACSRSQNIKEASHCDDKIAVYDPELAKRLLPYVNQAVRFWSKFSSFLLLVPGSFNCSRSNCGKGRTLPPSHRDTHMALLRYNVAAYAMSAAQDCTQSFL